MIYPFINKCVYSSNIYPPIYTSVHLLLRYSSCEATAIIMLIIPSLYEGLAAHFLILFFKWFVLDYCSLSIYPSMPAKKASDVEDEDEDVTIATPKELGAKNGQHALRSLESCRSGPT